MDQKELLELHDTVCKSARAIMEVKNHDYANPASTGDPFANFRRAEAMGVCSTERGFMVRMVDKLSRLSTFADTGTLKVANESFEDAILDLINYGVLLIGHVTDKQKALGEVEVPEPDGPPCSDCGMYAGHHLTGCKVKPKGMEGGW
jgi:hypothetical protein